MLDRKTSRSLDEKDRSRSGQRVVEVSRSEERGEKVDLDMTEIAAKP